MTEVVPSLEALGPGYAVLYCDLWGCLHDGRRVFPEAVAALERFRENGGAVVLLTNSPRPSRDVALQVRALGAPDGCYDLIVSSGDAAQAAMAAGLFGRRVHHIGPDRDAGFFLDDEGAPVDVERVPLAEADGIVCTGLFDDRTETPEDYRATLLDARSRGLKLLCANPDVVVDVGDRRIYCAGALAEAYAAAGGESYFFGKPHPPIYALTRQRLSEALGLEPAADEILCLGDGLATDIRGATGEGLDALFITGGLSAMETATSRSAGPDPERLAGLLARERLAPRYAMAVLR